MVSPAKTRTSGFSNLHDAPYDAAEGTRLQKTRVAGKYATTRDEDDKKRLRRLVDHVKQSLEPFYRSSGAGSGIHASVPAAETIRRFLDKASRAGADEPSTVDADGFRKCLYALGVNAEDTAYMLESLDLKHTGTIDRQAFVSTFLPMKTTTTGLQRRRFGGYEGDDGNNSSTIADERRRRDQDTTAAVSGIGSFHQKVIERVLVRYSNVKEAFRQYDSNRLGVLSATQFRTFMRDLGFVGRDIEALMRHIDRSNQQLISFNAFAHPGGKQLTSDQSYVKSPPKRKLMQPLDRSRRRDDDNDDNACDPMERIRAKLRQRVIGRSKSIREIFMEFDADGNGHLDHDEFKLFMGAYDFTSDETRAAIEFLDRDFSGTIDYDEFASGLLFYRPSPTAKAATRRAAAMTEDERQAKHGAYLLEVVKEKLSSVLLDKKMSVKFGNLREEFDKFDTDGSGALDYQEFGAFLMGLGVKLSPRDLEALMSVVDDDGSNQIEFDEFASVLGQRGSPISKKEPSPERKTEPHMRLSGKEPLEAAFARYDVDNSGLLDYSEFSQLLRDQGFRQADIVQATKQIDENGGGGIDLETVKSIVQSREWKISNIGATTMTAKATRSPLKQVTRQPKKFAVQAENMLVTRILRDHQPLEEAFRQHDLDGSGELDHDEFRRFMKHYGMREDKDIDQLIAKLDADGSGAVSLDEFMAHFQLKPTHTLPKGRNKEDQRLAALQELTKVWVEGVLDHHASLEHAFRDHDRQQRSELDYEEFRDLLCHYGISDDGNIRLLLSQLDSDQSGTVKLDEFLAFFQPLVASVRKSSKPDRRKSQIKSSATSGFAAEQAKTKAMRLRLLEEQWVQQALEAHGSVCRAFNQFDADQSGALDHEEFRRLMTTFGITRDDDIAMMIKRLDLDGSGSIDYDEFATVFHERRVRNGLGKTASGARKVSTVTTSETKSSSAARLRELELKWIKRALSCHPTIEAAFGEYDRDGNGTLDHEEFAHCMKRYGIARDEDIARLVKRLDLDGSGTIDYHEFSTVFNALRCDALGSMAALGGTGSGVGDQELDAEELASVMEIERELADRILKNTRDMRLAFRKFDINGNGKLEYAEFRTVLKSYKFPEPEIRKVIRHLDRDVSGFIDYREFIAGFAAVADAGGNGSATTNGSRRKSAARSSLKPSLKKQGTSSRLSGSRVHVDRVGMLKKSLLERILSSYGTVQSTFRKYDTARNGSLEPKQFEKMAVDMGFSRDEARVLLEHFDGDRSGTVEYDEFLSRLIAEGEPR